MAPQERQTRRTEALPWLRRLRMFHESAQAHRLATRCVRAGLPRPNVRFGLLRLQLRLGAEPMTKEVKTICNGCGKVKGEANRWWVIGPTSVDGLVIHSSRYETGDEDYCGEQCVLKRVQEFLAEVK